MPGNSKPTYVQAAADPRPRVTTTGNQRPGPAVNPAGVPSARVILLADAAWDALLGAALIAGTIAPVAHPLGAGSLKPWPLFVAVGAACLVISSLMVVVSAGPQAAAVCHSISPANILTTLLAVALLLALPQLAHPYVVALAVAAIGCGMFATLEWTVGSRR